MECRSKDAYVAVLRRLQQLGLNPRWAMTDFESVLQQAFLQVFPEVELHGCVWHYARVRYRKIANGHLSLLEITRCICYF